MDDTPELNKWYTHRYLLYKTYQKRAYCESWQEKNLGSQNMVQSKYKHENEDSVGLKP